MSALSRLTLKPTPKVPASSAPRLSAVGPGKTASPSKVPQSADAEAVSAMGWQELEKLGLSLGVSPTKPVPAPRVPTLTSSSSMPGMILSPEGTAAKYTARSTEDLRRRADEAEAKTVEAESECRALRAELASVKSEHAAALARKDDILRTTILEIERKHSVELSAVYQRQSEGKSGGPSSDDPSSAMDTMRVLLEQLDSSEAAARQSLRAAQDRHSAELAAVQEKHAAEKAALREDNARLMDSIGGYNRQLAELRQQLSEAGDRESRIADAAQLAEERAAERQSQIQELLSRNEALVKTIAAYRQIYEESEDAGERATA